MPDAGLRSVPEAVYFNGRVGPSHEARVAISDQGLLFGLGFFDTFRTSGGHPHQWSYHQARMTHSCREAGMVLPASFLTQDPGRMAQIVAQLLHENGYSDAVLRYTVTAGSADHPTEFLTTRPLPAAAPPEGVRLRVLKLRRDSGEWIPRPKSLNYANVSRGARELHDRQGHPSDEGLFLARQDNVVVETCRQNVLWITGGVVRFPEDSCGAVAGTCLAWLRECGGFAIEPGRATLAEFLQADALFCVNAVRGITPVSEVWDESDVTQLGSFRSAMHPMVLELQRRWAAALASTAGCLSRGGG